VAEERVSHVNVAVCADFARGVLGAKYFAAVQRHLTTCPKCAATARWLREVRAFAAADEQYEPPPHALTHAGALFAIERRRIIRTPADHLPP
jgi:anti-sigma factor RsiW